jgi:hypothetical protein
LKDNCDHAGVWKPNISKIKKLYGYDINLEKAVSLLNAGKERVMVLENGRIFLTGFIPFQYGPRLNLGNRLHLSIFRLLGENGVNLTSIRPQLESIEGLKDKDKEKDSSLSSLGKSENPFSIPNDLKDDELLILEWFEYKKQRQESYTSKVGATKFFNAFRAIPKDKRREAVDHSMANNWAGLFQKNGGNNGKIRHSENLGEPDKYDAVTETVKVR